MANSLIQLTSNLLTDVLSDLFGAPTATAQRMLYAYHEKRNKRAVRILLDEVRRGGSDITEVATQDEVVGVIYRYAIAVRDNVALANLRLLAQVIRGLASQRALYADRFDRYAVCLSSLTRDEVIVLGTLHKSKLMQQQS